MDVQNVQHQMNHRDIRPGLVNRQRIRWAKSSFIVRGWVISKCCDPAKGSQTKNRLGIPFLRYS